LNRDIPIVFSHYAVMTITTRVSCCFDMDIVVIDIYAVIAFHADAVAAAASAVSATRANFRILNRDVSRLSYG
jgi:hypothetical protein